MLRRGLTDLPGLVVASAGVVARDGDVVTPQTAAVGESVGVDLSEHRARYLDEMVVSGAQLLLAMNRSHRRSIVELVPRKVGASFTLREFARLSSSITDDDLARALASVEPGFARYQAAVALVAEQRGQVDPPVDPSDDDIVDPYRHDQQVYDLMADQLVPAAAQTVRYLESVGGL
jgi:protein-tyrosine phosphatase